MIESNNLSGEHYFTSILQEAYKYGILSDIDVENVQLQCIELLAYKSKKYNSGESSSIREETAENIMKSNFYTIGVYLKSLPDPDHAANELKTTKIFEMYKTGRKLIDSKIHTAKKLYKLVHTNKLITMNYTYNATIDENGIGIFFKSYNPYYEAHESPGLIDYQLCHPVTDLAGVEFIQKYLENLYLENEFCKKFAEEDIHHILYRYDEGYKDLLINIFEHVLMVALGSSLVNCSIVKLKISAKDINFLYNELSKCDGYTLTLKIGEAAEKIFEELNITSLSLQRYIKNSLPKIISNITCAVKTETLDKVLVFPVNPKLSPKIQFVSGVKMDDNGYRKLINELLICRYSSDKLALIREKVKSFDDLEDIILDAQLTKEEMTAILADFTDIEIAAMIRRHPYYSDVQAVNLSEVELNLQLSLKSYVEQLATDRQKHIFEMVIHLVDDY